MSRSSRISWIVTAVVALLAALPSLGWAQTAQTVYAVVLGHPKYVVGSSTLHSGLYRSTDRGATWQHLGPENLKGYSMDAVDSAKGRVLYIAAGNGVHRSVDSGRTWKIVTDWQMTEVLDVKVDQRDPRMVWAATAWGLWRSTDGGDTWTNPDGPLKETYIYHIQSIHDIFFRYAPKDALRPPGDTSARWMPDIGQDTALWEPVDMVVAGERGRWLLIGDSLVQVTALMDTGPMLQQTQTVNGTPVYKEPPPPIDLASGLRGYFPIHAQAGFLATSRGPIFEDRFPIARSINAKITGGPAMNTYDIAVSWKRESQAWTVGDSGVWRLDTKNYYEWKWQDITGNLPTRTVHTVAMVDGTLLVGTFGEGIHRREGERWIPSGLEGSQVWRLVVKDF